MRSLTELSPEDQIETGRALVTPGWIEELGVIVINETTRLALHNPAEPELGWRFEETADIIPLATPLSEPKVAAA